MTPRSRNGKEALDRCKGPGNAPPLALGLFEIRWINLIRKKGLFPPGPLQLRKGLPDLTIAAFKEAPSFSSSQVFHGSVSSSWQKRSICGNFRFYLCCMLTILSVKIVLNEFLPRNTLNRNERASWLGIMEVHIQYIWKVHSMTRFWVKYTFFAVSGLPWLIRGMWTIFRIWK